MLEIMKKFQINTPHDIAVFFFWLAFEKRVGFHPDDSFFEYVNHQTRERSFTDEEAEEYNKTMDECRAVCEKYHSDIYEIAVRVLELFTYCDRNSEKADEAHLRPWQTLALSHLEDATNCVDAIIPRKEDKDFHKHALQHLKKVKTIISTEKEDDYE